jgi:hypothetical protein
MRIPRNPAAGNPATLARQALIKAKPGADARRNSAPYKAFMHSLVHASTALPDQIAPCDALYGIKNAE